MIASGPLLSQSIPSVSPVARRDRANSWASSITSGMRVRVAYVHVLRCAGNNPQKHKRGPTNDHSIKHQASFRKELVEVGQNLTRKHPGSQRIGITDRARSGTPSAEGLPRPLTNCRATFPSKTRDRTAALAGCLSHLLTDTHLPVHPRDHWAVPFSRTELRMRIGCVGGGPARTEDQTYGRAGAARCTQTGMGEDPWHLLNVISRHCTPHWRVQGVGEGVRRS